jgi:hypothetical protein
MSVSVGIATTAHRAAEQAANAAHRRPSDILKAALLQVTMSPYLIATNRTLRF